MVRSLGSIIFHTLWFGGTAYSLSPINLNDTGAGNLAHVRGRGLGLHVASLFALNKHSHSHQGCQIYDIHACWVEI